MAILILLIALMGPTVYTVELIEVNYCYNGSGLRFTQVIYWGRYDDGLLHVRDYHMLDKYKTIYRWGEGISVIRKGFREVRAPHYKVTHTHYDPEKNDRRVLPVNKRKPFREVIQ